MGKVRYAVARLNWRRAGKDWVRVPGEVRLASFGTAAEAEADAARREAEAREAVNPFRCGRSLFYLSAMPEPVFRDWLADAGIELPKKPAEWAKWWDKEGGSLTPAQRAKVWEGLNKVRFFRAEERPAKPVAYAVVEVDWHYNDEWFYSGPEGGEVLTLFRSREKAEKERETRDAAARRKWEREFAEMGLEPDGDDEDESFRQLDDHPRREAAADPFAPPRKRDWKGGDGLKAPDEVPLHEVIEVELEGV